MIRRYAEDTLRNLARQFKAVAVIGPRQSGKTTLSRNIFPDKQYVNLENPDTRIFAMEDPRGFLSQFPDGAVLDEIQRAPELFSYLQQILDENPGPGQFILTGSNNFLLQENISQSLAGRIAYLVLLPFSAFEPDENITPEIPELLIKGLYPPLYDQPVDHSQWYANYIRTYIERDVRQIKNISNLYTFERFVRLCAGRSGQMLNISNLAIETGIDNKTIASWIGILESSFILFRLYPHSRNFNKRVVKMPKIYFYDTGLACALLGIRDVNTFSLHPYAGCIFENFVVSELIKFRFNKALPSNLYFWRDNVGHEIDILVENGDRLFPVEIKSGKTITPEYFKNLLFWQSISGQNHGAVVYAGEMKQERSNGISVLPWRKMIDLVQMGVI
jgi:predicted AAA+ superfamily ATPase